MQDSTAQDQALELCVAALYADSRDGMRASRRRQAVQCLQLKQLGGLAAGQLPLGCKVCAQLLVVAVQLLVLLVAHVHGVGVCCLCRLAALLHTPQTEPSQTDLAFPLAGSSIACSVWGNPHNADQQAYVCMHAIQRRDCEGWGCISMHGEAWG